MCLYPKLILNRKYIPNKKNKGNVQLATDIRAYYVPVGCGNCIECRKQKAREWQVRLHEELKAYPKAYFVTLTFSPEELKKLCEETKLKECNAVCGKALRRFQERWRKKFKTTVRHWFITELGHTGTERIHMHGIIFTNQDPKNIIELWKYGNPYIGEYCNAKTINYIIKYVTKIDEDHKDFKAQIFASKGLGKNYLNTWSAEQNKFNSIDTREYYTLPNGGRVNLPIYYRNHIYNEEEREKLWMQKLDKETRYVLGEKIRTNNISGEKKYFNKLKQAQEYNERIGYGTDGKEWQEKEYNITTRMISNITKGKQIQQKSIENVMSVLQNKKK